MDFVLDKQEIFSQAIEAGFNEDEIVVAFDSFSEELVNEAIQLSLEHPEIKDKDIFYWCIRFVTVHYIQDGKTLPVEFFPKYWKANEAV